MKQLVAVFVTVLASTLFSVSVWAGDAYSIEDTDIGTLMDDPKAKAILLEHLPATTSNSQFTMAYGFSLRFIASFDQTGELTEENLTKIDAELKKLSAE